MKNATSNMKRFSYLLAFIILSCNSGNAPAPLKFKAYEKNPILIPGKQGDWDELFLWNPQVIKDDGMFYLFYLGGNISGRMSIGLATSSDGYHFTKFRGNPVLSPDNEGFDAYTVGPGIILKKEPGWLMYYNAQNLRAFAPGPAAGMATAPSPEGPWAQSEDPIIKSGTKGEWDAGFIIPSTVIFLKDGRYLMFYSGGTDIALFDDFCVGMAESSDGINWKKYNDPLTTKHPFTESDPVMIPGRTGEWDGGFIWMANVTEYAGGFTMYYSGSATNNREDLKAIGFATSRDGILWEKYPGNPVYRSEDDPFILSQGKIGYMENPYLLYLDTVCYMYYECGPFQVEKSFISMAIGRVR
jgi:hypothetical protein